MVKKNILCLSLLLLVSSLHTVIIKIDHLRGTIPELESKKFIFYSDVHQQNCPQDEEQLDALEQIFIKKNRGNPEPMHILVEQPTWINWFQSYPKITPHLKERLKNCQKTEVENIEIRCVGNAAHYVLNPHINPFDLPSYFSPADIEFRTPDASCTPEDITFNDLLQEFDHYNQLILNWKESTSEIVKHAIQRHFDLMLSDYQDLCETLQTLNISLEQKILDVSKEWYHAQPINREGLTKRIDIIFKHLFELHIIKRIFSLETAKIIALIAGAAHTETIRSILLDMGNKQTASYGIPYFQQSQELIPLKPYYLEPSLEYNTYCQIL